MRLLFMGSPDFAVPILEALNKKFDIIEVYTQAPKKKGRGNDDKEMGRG